MANDVPNQEEHRGLGALLLKALSGAGRFVTDDRSAGDLFPQLEIREMLRTRKTKKKLAGVNRRAGIGQQGDKIREALADPDLAGTIDAIRDRRAQEDSIRRSLEF